MIEWKRPSGTIVETNNDKRSIAAAKKLGWKRVKKTQDQEKEPAQDQENSIKHSLTGNI